MIRPRRRLGGLGNGRASLRRSAQRRFGSSACSSARPWRRPPRMAGGAFSSPTDGVARSNRTNAFYSGSSTTTRRDQEERIDAPLAEVRENQVDERHESWKSMYVESHKDTYLLRWKHEILQVVPGRARLHRNCGATSTRNPRPPHVNVGFKRAPQVREDKITQVNIEMREGGSWFRARKCAVQPGVRY